MKPILFAFLLVNVLSVKVENEEDANPKPPQSNDYKGLSEMWKHRAGCPYLFCFRLVPSITEYTRMMFKRKPGTENRVPTLDDYEWCTFDIQHPDFAKDKAANRRLISLYVDGVLEQEYQFRSNEPDACYGSYNLQKKEKNGSLTDKDIEFLVEQVMKKVAEKGNSNACDYELVRVGVIKVFLGPRPLGLGQGSTQKSMMSNQGGSLRSQSFQSQPNMFGGDSKIMSQNNFQQPSLGSYTQKSLTSGGDRGFQSQVSMSQQSLKSVNNIRLQSAGNQDEQAFQQPYMSQQEQYQGGNLDQEEAQIIMDADGNLLDTTGMTQQDIAQSRKGLSQQSITGNGEGQLNFNLGSKIGSQRTVQSSVDKYTPQKGLSQQSITGNGEGQVNYNLGTQLGSQRTVQGFGEQLPSQNRLSQQSLTGQGEGQLNYNLGSQGGVQKSVMTQQEMKLQSQRAFTQPEKMTGLSQQSISGYGEGQIGNNLATQLGSQRTVQSTGEKLPSQNRFSQQSQTGQGEGYVLTSQNNLMHQSVQNMPDVKLTSQGGGQRSFTSQGGYDGGQKLVSVSNPQFTAQENDPNYGVQNFGTVKQPTSLSQMSIQGRGEGLATVQPKSQTSQKGVSQVGMSVQEQNVVLPKSKVGQSLPEQMGYRVQGSQNNNYSAPDVLYQGKPQSSNFQSQGGVGMGSGQQRSNVSLKSVAYKDIAKMQEQQIRIRI